MQAIFYNDWNHSHIPEILEEIYIKKVYEPFLNGKKNLTIVDIGANIGLTTFFFKDFGKVYSLEPSKLHFDTLVEMLQYNKIKNVVASKIAISNKAGKEKFYLNPNNTSHSLTIANDANNFEMVDVLTLEEYMKEQKLDKIDILKLDTEGEESKIITSDGFKNVADKIKVIVGEYHDWTPMNKIMFKKAFEDLGFQFNWYFNTNASVFSAVRV